MKSLLILCAGSMALFGSFGLSAQVPVIISQPTDVSACDGDSVSLVVIAEGNCRLQWFTAQKNGSAFTNYIEIAGETFYRLTLNPVHVTNAYYLLRLTGETDTIWSEGIMVSVHRPQKLIADTLFVNHVPGYARLFDGIWATNPQLIWSEGDTTIFPGGNTYVQFDNFGKHWVKTIQYGCSRTDTFIVAECPHILHIDSVTPTPECLCADTVYIERDVNGRVASVASGTTIKFTGDYRFSSAFMDARAIGNDSIVFEGHFDPITQKWQGQLHSYSRSPYTREPTRFESTIIKHLKIITLDPGNGQVTFYRNEHINKYGAAKCIFYQNKLIEIYGSASGCTFLENDTVLGHTSQISRSNIYYFIFSQNIFINNKSGLIIRGNSNGPVLISKCIFQRNPAPAINIEALTFSNYIDQNLFIKNTPNNGSSVIRSLNYTVFRNNTLINNQGACDLLLTDLNSSGVGGEILNNIFWNSSGKRTTLKLQGSASIMKISHNSFGGDSTCLIVPIDTNVTVVNNLFSTYPDFADTVHYNYRLKETSSLIDKGTDIEHGPVMLDFYYTKDFIGFPRKTGLAIDPGAYEYHAIMPLAFHYVTPDTVVCDKDTITLKAIPEGGFNENNMIFTWYLNGSKKSSNSPYRVVEGAYINVKADYEAEMTNGIDTIRTGPIHLTKLQKPDLSFQSVYQLACAGKDLSLKVTKPQAQTNYWWTSARQGPLGQPTTELILPNFIEGDTITITATNACGSAQSGPIIIRVAPLPAPSLGADTTLHAGDSLLLDAGEGVLYAWSSGDTIAQIYGYPNDTAWVTVTNAYGCTGSDTVVISIVPSGLDEPGAHGLKLLIYPNPARDRIFIRIPEEVELPCRLQLIALNGAVVFEAVLPNKGLNECNLTSLEKGTYTFNLLAGTARGIGRLVIW